MFYDQPGRPAFRPTEKQRIEVAALVSFGVPLDQIHPYIGISLVTFRKYFKKEIETAALRANAAVATSMYKLAISAESEAARVSAGKYWLGARAGWKEAKVELNVSGEVTVSANDAKARLKALLDARTIDITPDANTVANHVSDAVVGVAPRVAAPTLDARRPRLGTRPVNGHGSRSASL